MNLGVDSAGRGRSWQRSPRTLVHSFVVPTHVPRSAMDTSVTAHCHAAPAQLTRAYQSDHRRHVLTPTTTSAVDHTLRPSPPSITPVHHPLTTPSISGVRSELASEATTGPRGARSAPPNPDYDKAKSLLPAVAFLSPRVAAHVVAVLLPETGAVAGHELEAADPLGAFPEIEVRHEQP
jgi:hypothetical protein